MATRSRTKKKTKASVFAVPSDETSSGFHKVIFAKDGDLNKAGRRGDIRNFRKWDKAKDFAVSKGREIKAEVVIHSFGRSRGRMIDFTERVKITPRAIKASKSRMPAITPRLRKKL